MWEMTGGRWIGFGASTIEGGSTFLFRNFSLLAAFRLRVEGLDFFFFFGKGAVSLESKKKVKVEPTVTEKEKALPWSEYLIKLLVQETHVVSSTRLSSILYIHF